MTDNKQDKNAQNNIEKDVVVAETAEQNNTENDVVETAATENNNIENAAGQNDEIQATAGDSVSEENADSQEEEQVKEPKKSHCGENITWAISIAIRQVFTTR